MLEKKMSDERLYLALDLPDVDEARGLVKLLGDHIESYKIGLQLLAVGGVELGQELKAMGKNIFYDYKFHDIGATVEKATRSICSLDANLLTVHARPEVMKSAVLGRESSDLKILAVTVLTSLNKKSLEKIGYHQNAEELVLRRVDQALECGVDGVVASPLEVSAIKKLVPEDFLIVTPGIRMLNDNKDDQKRVSTPGASLASGASHLVVGRSITKAVDPRKAAIEVIRDMRINQ
ncbi:orotidine-5'-phosphate decarboxylase [Hellea sp.]|jgi:orotidine-5'-phosphate decarboxylase|nr:orotidine-5'-phosphate decarboxylase [Hellea sp.]